MKRYARLLFCALVSAALAAPQANPKLANLADNTWMILDSTGISLSGHFAYSGGAYDRANHQFLAFGGGHYDGWQNDILAFDIASDTWKSMYTPDPQSSYNCGNVNNTTPGMLLNTGMPASRHTYDMIEFMDHIGKIIVWSGPTYSGIWSCAGNTLPKDTWLYDYATNEWEYKNTARLEQPSGEAMCGAYNPVNQRYYGFNNSDFYTYNAAADTWAKLPASTGTKPTGYDHSMVTGRNNGNFYLFDGQMKIYSTTGNSWASSTGAPSGTNDNPSYDEAWNDVLCLGSNASAMHVFHTASKTWEVLTPSGPTPQMDNICYGRFFYDSVDNVHLYMAQVNYRARTWAYRYKKGSGTKAEAAAIPGGALSISPNPVEGLAAIHLPGDFAGASVRILDLGGRTIARLSTAGDRQTALAWNSRTLPNGLYLVTAEKKGKKISRKILVRR